jgi:hypothetical protein
MEITDIPNCPECGERLVPVIFQVSGYEYTAFMCDCANEKIADELKLIRERGSVLVVEHVNDVSEETCQDCLFSGVCFPEPFQFSSPN